MVKKIFGSQMVGKTIRQKIRFKAKNAYVESTSGELGFTYTTLALAITATVSARTKA